MFQVPNGLLISAIQDNAAQDGAAPQEPAAPGEATTTESAASESAPAAAATTQDPAAETSAPATSAPATPATETPTTEAQAVPADTPAAPEFDPGAPAGNSAAPGQTASTTSEQTTDPASAPADTDTSEQTSETVAQEPTAPGTPEASGPNEFLVLLAVILVLVVPFVLGRVIAGALKVQDWWVRIGTCLLALTLGLTPFISAKVANPDSTLLDSVRLGIDLAGGTNIVFQVEGGDKLNDDIMEKMVRAVNERINLSGTEEVTVRQVNADRIEVIVPGEDPQTVDEIKRRIVNLGKLEFYIVASEQEDAEIVAEADQLSESEKVLKNPRDEVIARWVPAYEKNNVPKFLRNYMVNDRAPAYHVRNVTQTRTVNGKLENYTTEEYLLLIDPPERQVSGKYLKLVTPGINPENGQLMVSFNLDQKGGFLMGDMTSRFSARPGRASRHMAIVLNDMVYSAPTLQTTIHAS
ncbi:MAG: hypothetical protein KDA85_02730, partial [Planctomycetaceae bacterium]|nr:hypothetical protein [Planctomycetaceae bacterium]